MGRLHCISISIRADIKSALTPKEETMQNIRQIIEGSPIPVIAVIRYALSLPAEQREVFYQQLQDDPPAELVEDIQRFMRALARHA